MNNKTREKTYPHQKHILIVGDASDAMRDLCALFEQKGYNVTTVPEGRDVPQQIRDTQPDFVLTTVQQALNCHAQQLEVSRAPTELESTAQREADPISRAVLPRKFKHIIGKSVQMIKVLERIEKFAKAKSNVLIEGETGTGKELVARALHENSNRAGKKMVVVNCAAIPETMLENELFGHEQGSFTDATAQYIGDFERAHKSTLFLDEIGEMPLPLQPKLLRALQEHEIKHIGGTGPVSVDVRIVAATNTNLWQAVEDGEFRADLYYRLATLPICLPPLRERPEDIPVLVKHFIEKHGEGKFPGIAPRTLELLLNYEWPGNIRELENAIEFALVCNQRNTFLPKDLPEKIENAQLPQLNSRGAPASPETQTQVSFAIGTPLHVVERKMIETTLASMDGNRAKTAKALKVSVGTIYNKIRGPCVR